MLRRLTTALLFGCLLVPVSEGRTPGQNHGHGHGQDDLVQGGILRYEVVAASPRLNRKVTGPVTGYVNGVPAEPVDSFVYDGEGSVAIDGHLVMTVLPGPELGFVQASWTDDHGDWTYTQTKFLHPDHYSGVKLGTSISWLDWLINEGVVANVYLHGDTEAGMPVLPTVFAFVATWGPANVTLDGKPFDNPFEIPAPQWVGHVMVTEGVRWPDGTVRTVSGGIYDPGKKAEGATEAGDVEVHLVFHDERFPMTTSFPPLYSFFYHLVFEDVTFRVVESQGPIDLDPDSPPTPMHPKGGR